MNTKEELEELREIRSRIEIIENKMDQLLPFTDKPAPKDRKQNYHRRQLIYDRIDIKSKEELKKVRNTLYEKYKLLFQGPDETLTNARSVKLERLYTIIDNRIAETLKLWR